MMKRQATPPSLVEAKKIACRRWPWAAEAIMFEMATVCRPGLGTLAVDMYWRMYYDPAFLEGKTTEEIATVVLHELCHLVFRHHQRGQFLLGDECTAIENRNWQWATDVSVNEILYRERHPFPGEPITRGSIRRRFRVDVGHLPSAEEAFRKLQEADGGSIMSDHVETYEKLLKEKPDDGEETDDSAAAGGTGAGDGDAEQEVSDHGGGAGEDNRGSGSPDGGGDQGSGVDEDSGGADDEPQCGSGGSDRGDGQADGENDGGEDTTNSSADGTTKPPEGMSGSCADGIQKSWELGPPQDIRDGVGADRECTILATIAKNVVAGRGKAPGAFKAWATKIIDPSIDPKQQILRVIKKHVDLARGRGKRSYRRPNRRHVGSQFLLPSNYSAEPRITVCVDSSGSMREDDTALAIGLINKVLSSFRNRRGVKVLVGDTEGRTTELVHSRLNRMLSTGGGGTNMGKLIEDAVASKPVPHVILVATDGDTPWPSEDPGVPVLACLTREGYESRVPEWMTTLKIYN